MLLESALIEYFSGAGEFAGLGVQNLQQTYDWKLPRSTPMFIGSGEGLSNYEANIRLKSALSDIWKSNPARRSEITRWVISDWGGIRGNSAEKIDYYSLEAARENPETPMEGIASFSKVLAIADPDRFAILDARIVVSLNAIQIISKVEDGVVFPYLQGRNLTTGHTGRKVGFSQNPMFSQKRLLKEFKGWRLAEKNSAYSVYLDLLHNLCTKPALSCSILPLEMALFANAERLANLCKSIRVEY